jgi:cobalt-zinc-cadmium efflux system protein
MHASTATAGFWHPDAMHAHSHDHDDTQDRGASRRIGWAFWLNASFMGIEFIGGWLTNSTAIMADAVHDLGDSLSLGSAWLLERVSRKRPDAAYTYGYRRLSLFGAFLNAVVLVVGSAFVLVQSLPRLLAPQMPQAEGMLGLAVLGIVVNGIAVLKLRKGATLNEKVLNWHLLEDVLGWVAVLLVSLVLLVVDWPVLDPLLAIVFTLFILTNIWRSLKETLRLFFQAVPTELLTHKIHLQLLELEPVAAIHHEHLWSLDGEQHVYTAHLVLKRALTFDEQRTLKDAIAERLQPFALTHTTIELELPEEVCRDGEGYSPGEGF